MRISEIFLSIEGEGIRAGYPAIFIRTYGCNLRCSYCDSMYALEGGDYIDMTLADIMRRVRQYKGVTRYVTVTGGEPLIQSGMKELLAELADSGFDVNVETNGAVPIEGVTPKVMITMDWKCPSSNMCDQMITENLEGLISTDVLKFVVGSQEDLRCMKRILEEQGPALKCHVFVSPVFGKIESKEIVQFLLDNCLSQVRIQLQLHKFIWDPNMRGV